MLPALVEDASLGDDEETTAAAAAVTVVAAAADSDLDFVCLLVSFSLACFFLPFFEDDDEEEEEEEADGASSAVFDFGEIGKRGERSGAFGGGDKGGGEDGVAM